VLSQSEGQTRNMWKIREGVAEAGRADGPGLSYDISVSVSKIPEFIDKGVAAALAILPSLRPHPLGHIGDGNVHFNVSQPVGADKAEFLAQWGAVNARVHEIVGKFHGSISAEHGIGRLKRDVLPHVKDPVALELMRALKHTLDPNGILNPGKLL